MSTAFNSDSNDKKRDIKDKEDISNNSDSKSISRGRHYKQDNDNSISIQELLEKNGRELKKEDEPLSTTSQNKNIRARQAGSSGMQKMMANKSKNPAKLSAEKTKENPATQRRIVSTVTSVKKDEENKPIEKEKSEVITETKHVSNKTDIKNKEDNQEKIDVSKVSNLDKISEKLDTDDKWANIGEYVEDIKEKENEPKDFSLDGIDDAEDDLSAYGIREQGRIHREQLEAEERERKKREERKTAIEKSKRTQSLDENILKGSDKKVSINELNVPLGSFSKNGDSQGKVAERYLKLQEGHELPNIPFDKRVEVFTPVKYGFKSIFKSFFSYLMYAFVSIFTFTFCWIIPVGILGVFLPVDTDFFKLENIEDIGSIFSLSNFFEIFITLFGVIAFMFAVGAVVTINASLGLQDVNKENINEKITLRQVLSEAKWKRGILSTMFIMLFNFIIVFALALSLYLIDISILYKLIIVGIIGFIYLLLMPTFILAPYYAIEGKSTITGALSNCFNDVKKAFGSSFISMIIVNLVANLWAVVPILGLTFAAFNSVGIAHIYRQVSHGYAPHV